MTKTKLVTKIPFPIPRFRSTKSANLVNFHPEDVLSPMPVKEVNAEEVAQDAEAVEAAVAEVVDSLAREEAVTTEAPDQREAADRSTTPKAAREEDHPDSSTMTTTSNQDVAVAVATEVATVVGTMVTETTREVTEAAKAVREDHLEETTEWEVVATAAPDQDQDPTQEVPAHNSTMKVVMAVTEEALQEADSVEEEAVLQEPMPQEEGSEEDTEVTAEVTSEAPDHREVREATVATETIEIATE